MIRFLLNAAISLVLAVIALLLAGALVDGVTLEPGGFIVAVAVFTLIQAIIGPFVFNVARKHASAMLGGIGLVSTLIALFVATLFPGGLHISTFTAWIATPVLVWVITALGTWLFGWLILQRWWDRRQEAKTIRKATKSA